MKFYDLTQTPSTCRTIHSKFLATLQNRGITFVLMKLIFTSTKEVM